MRRFHEITILLILLFSNINAQIFSEVQNTGIDATIGLTGCAWGDYDNDGDLDLFQPGKDAPSILYRNDGNNVFTNVSEGPYAVFVDSTGDQAIGGIWGDFNNDGDLDLMFADGRIRLYINEGGQFTDQSSSIGTGESFYPRSMPVAASDYDKDGDLDFAFAGGAITSDIPRIYINTDASFINKWDELAGTEILMESPNPMWVDIDNDGDEDLWLPNRTDNSAACAIFLTDGDNLIFDDPQNNGIDVPLALTSTWADFNRDGLFDLFLVPQYQSADNKAKLFQNQGLGTFTDVAHEMGIDSVLENCSAVLTGDYDNDGDIDIFAAQTEGGQYLWRNDGDIFTLEENSGLPAYAENYQAQMVDSDNDGFLDIYAGSWDGPKHIFRNQGNMNHWVGFTLHGTTNNKSGIGARISLISGNIIQHKVIQAGAGGMTNGHIRQHFGLADSSIVDSVFIQWPNGVLDYIEYLPADHYYDVVEGIGVVGLVSADFEADTTYGIDSLTVSFTDLSTHDTSNAISSWQWDFNNDNIIDSEEENPSHTYTKPGIYSVKLIVSSIKFTNQLVKENYITIRSSHPHIDIISDIPNDQGSWVKVQFAGSGFDSDSLIFPKTASAELYTVEIDDGSGWTATASTAAYGKSIYSVLVPTTKDSTAESDGLINFRVIAAMNEGNYTSQEMTGYSVDNLAPVVPQGLLGKLSGSVIELSWQENLDNDFKYYTIYRGDNGSQLQAIRTSIQPVFNDQDITAGHDYSYALSATDHSCNESALSETINLTVTALDEVSAIPDKYYLGQNFPNPFNPTTTITFGLKESTKVRLMVYDILGNQVAELVNTIFPAGRYQVEWDGTNSFSAMAGTGIYYYKLETEKYSSVKKMIYIK